ncbi:hypothetical protein [Cellulosimicrobium sp. NPDC057862]|uniref:hypothetical protein n=1 Tax=Cellulosimicrobium sp. NPDC057862 TaxID=3346266 RepID=UPI00366B3C51
MTSPVPTRRVGAALALLGAGIVDLGLVRGGFPAPSGLLALATGTTELVAALVLLARGPRPGRPAAVPRLGIALLLGATVAGVAAPVASGVPLSAGAAAAAVLRVATACVLARPARVPADDAPARAGARLVALFSVAVVVSAVATFGLGGTDAAQHAVPHGAHLPALGNLPGHGAGHHGESGDGP